MAGVVFVVGSWEQGNSKSQNFLSSNKLGCDNRVCERLGCDKLAWICFCERSDCDKTVGKEGDFDSSGMKAFEMGVDLSFLIVTFGTQKFLRTCL